MRILPVHGKAICLFVSVFALCSCIPALRSTKGLERRLASTDAVRILYWEPGKSKRELLRITDSKEVNDVVSNIHVCGQVESCSCTASIYLEFESLLMPDIVLSIHHGRQIRGWLAGRDLVLTDESANWLENWLAGKELSSSDKGTHLDEILHEKIAQ